MSDPAAGQAIPIRPSLATRASHSHRPPPHDDLEKHKGAIKRLYLDDGHTLREVMGAMEEQYGVKASYGTSRFLPSHSASTSGCSYLAA